jgi:predicted nucleic acid-binding protein
MLRLGIDPLIRNNFIDSCAFDPKYEPETSSSNEIFTLSQAGHFLLHIAHSAQKEIDHPNTPISVKRAASALIFSMPVQLTQPEAALLNDITDILAGTGKVDNVVQDAQHVFEAQKYGYYFITTDKRILARAETLEKRCSVGVVLPSEFLRIARHFIVQKQNEA